MKRFNEEIFKQLVESNWNHDNLSFPINYRNTAPYSWAPSFRRLLYRQTLNAKKPWDYNALAEEAVAGLKKSLRHLIEMEITVDEKFRDTSISLYPLNEGTAIKRDGKIVVPNEYVSAKFYGKDNPKLYWKDVVAEAYIYASLDTLQYDGYRNFYNKRDHVRNLNPLILEKE